MTNDEPTLEQLQEDLKSFTGESLEARKAADEAKAAITSEKDKEKIPALQEAFKEADETATGLEQDVATIKGKIAELQAAADHGAGPGPGEEPKSSAAPVEGMPCTYHMMVNGPRVIEVPAVVRRVHTKPKGSKAAGIVDLELMQPGKRPQTLERIARGDAADKWSPIEE